MKIQKIVQLHDDLNPKLWRDYNLHREVELHLLQIAKEFIDFINISDLKLEDVTISGSNCSFNYNQKSDIDLHLVVDKNKKCYDHLKELFLAKKNLFNIEHDITIRGIPVEVYVQESSQKHISNGIFSVVKDKWIVHPKPITVNIDRTNVIHKVKSLRFEVNQALKSGKLDELSKIKTKLKNMRQAGLEKNGEFGPENLAYKLLRNDGLLDKLYDRSTAMRDKQLSINKE